MKLALEIGIYTLVKGIIKYYGRQYKSVRSTLLTEEGSEKMMMENNEETTTTTNAGVADRLPVLGTKQLALAKSKTSWAAWFWEAEVGYIHHDETVGVTWQLVDEGKVRCIRVWDDAYCYESLAMMRASMQLVDLEVELDPYVVVTPYTPRPVSEASQEVCGLEVA
ncbi:MAG: hypothetical protein CMA83_00675 [Euryarchaeota archaeon]|nr:hypothetical protein [Euryarchaeota archaeon]